MSCVSESAMPYSGSPRFSSRAKSKTGKFSTPTLSQKFEFSITERNHTASGASSLRNGKMDGTVTSVMSDNDYDRSIQQDGSLLLCAK